jgi:hypothetical protein
MSRRLERAVHRGDAPHVQAVGDREERGAVALHGERLENLLGEGVESTGAFPQRG